MRLSFRLPGGSFFEQLTPPALLPPFLQSDKDDDRKTAPSPQRPGLVQPVRTQVANAPTLLTRGAPGRRNDLNSQLPRPFGRNRHDRIGGFMADDLNFR